MGAFPNDAHIAFQHVPAQIAQRTIESTCFEQTTVGEIFGDSGYETWHLSKWHPGHGKRACFPNERGRNRS